MDFLQQLVLISNHSVKVLVLPDGGGPGGLSYQRFRRKRLPRLDDPLQPHAIEGLDNNVDVIVHDYVSMEKVALLLEKQQR